MNSLRYWRSAVSHTEAALVVAGLRPHRPRYDVSPTHWDREYASGALDHYDSVYEQARYAVLTGYLGELAPRSILDIGCGVGLLRRRIEHLGFERYVGIDPSSVAVDEARASEYSRSEFRVGTVPAAKYDAIVCNEMLYYVEDLDDLLDRITRSLETGGRLITSIYRHPGDFALHRRLAKAFRPLDAVQVGNTLTGHRWRLATYVPN